MVTTHKTPSKDVNIALEHMNTMAKKILFVINLKNDLKIDVSLVHKYVPVIDYSPITKKVIIT